MSLLPAPPVKSELSRYRLLSPSAGVRVLLICLGTMSLGQAWSHSFGGGASKEDAFKFLDTFWEHGGNFIDTANNYQDQESEIVIGEWMKARENRDQIVLATKYTIGHKNEEQGIKLKVNYQGNHRKSLVLSVEDSLKKLQTGYIDLLYLHMWDYSTSIPEIMQALDALVKQNKVLYLGISDTPAWLVVKANEYARAHGMAQFIVHQGQWSLTTREMEREIIPMCRMEGMGICPWGVIGQGGYKPAAELKGTTLRHGREQSAAEKSMSLALEKVAQELGDGASLGSVAIAWTLHKTLYVFPVIGGRKPEQLLELIKGLSIQLSPAQIETLEAAAPFHWGFPYDFFGPALTNGVGNIFVQLSGHTKFVLAEQPLKPGPVASELRQA